MNKEEVQAKLDWFKKRVIASLTLGSVLLFSLPHTGQPFSLMITLTAFAIFGWGISVAVQGDRFRKQLKG